MDADKVQQRIFDATGRYGEILLNTPQDHKIGEACIPITEALNEAWALLCDGGDLVLASERLDFAEKTLDEVVKAGD